ncbi:hypothetical protein NW754_008577 [Fusarium falciforme]|nr:hypothetical protein NW754_008577 [Fusarium falciforme]
MDWLAQALGLPECFLSGGSTHGGGVIHGSASEAILTNMVAAREKYLAAVTAHLPDDTDEKEEALWEFRSKLVAVGSSGTHSSTKKAAQILGVRFATVPVFEEDGFSMTRVALETTISDLRALGLHPFYITTTLGSTDIWVHVDAAYAGTALLLDENKHLAKTFSSFHSFSFNPHKWMLTTFDCSAVWVRRRAWFIQALSIKPPYLRNQFSDDELVTDYRDWQIPLGRRFRSLKLWFVLRSFGVKGLQAHVRHGIELGESLQAKIESRPDLFTVFTKARFGLVTLRVNGSTEEEINERTEAVYEKINADGEFFLTATVINRKFAIRVCTGVAKVEEEHVQRVFEVLVEQAESRVLKKPVTNGAVDVQIANKTETPLVNGAKAQATKA